jgi:hypothetical protein
MKFLAFICICLSILLASCNPAENATLASSPTSPPGLTPLPFTVTPRITMLPTWTPSSTSPILPTRTPRPTPTTLLMTDGASARRTPNPAAYSTELLIDRPSSAQLNRPENLVSLIYDPNTWSLNTIYLNAFMGYSLTHRSIYDCKLEPSLGNSPEGYQVENFDRAFGSTTFQVSRFSQAGVLFFTNYCTGDGLDYTCYQLTPGSDHEACTQAAETVLATFKLIPDPFYVVQSSSPDQWLCQDQSGASGLCQISYSVPLNTLAFTPDGQAWVAGDDGLIYRRIGSTWSEFTSPSVHPIYDLSFSSPSDGWAVGAGAQVLHWDGNTWSEVLPYHGPGEGPGGSTQVLYSVDAHSLRDVWMVGAMRGIDGKTVPYALHWDGKDLVEQASFPQCNCGLNAVLVSGKDDVFAVGGSDLGAIAFHWDGSAWSDMLLKGGDHLYALYETADGSLWTAGLEVARDQSDTRGTLFRWDGATWHRIALPPLTGGIYSLVVPPAGQIILGGDFTALRSGFTWQPIIAGIAGYGWIADIETDPQGTIWALTHSGNIFRLSTTP